MSIPVKAVVICGPTATGKTALALKLAPLIGGEIISVDSRQVYIGMDIGTGKDKPADNQIIYGYDLVKPNESFSVANYYHYVQQILPGIIARQKLPLFVGGTGFYLKALIEPFATQTVPIDLSLRQQLDQLPVTLLQQKLQTINPPKWSSLNPSDRANPRRLIRAIETAQKPIHPVPPLIEPLMIGLTLPLAQLDETINRRVLKRAQPTFTQELKDLAAHYGTIPSPALSATGYQEWQQYLAGTFTKAEAIARWQQRERQYARRQLTWFKKQPGINWYDASSPDLIKNVVALVKSWYHKINET